MYQKFDDIVIKNNKYKFIFCDTIGLLMFVKNKNNINYKESLIKIMKMHRNNNFEILDFVIENFFAEKKDKKVKYLIIHDNNEILSTSRIIYDKEVGYINAVHTNIKFRGKSICQSNIQKLITLTNDLFNIKIFQLDVDIDNISAIKCYEKNGFEIIEKINNHHGEYYKMTYNISNKKGGYYNKYIKYKSKYLDLKN